MSLLPQVKTELVRAAKRPARARRVSIRIAAAIVAAAAALLVTAPPTVAQLPASVAAAVTNHSRL